jgi:hypothetical protein
MVSTNRVLTPRAEKFEEKGKRVTEEGLSDIRGKTVVFVANGRPNSELIMAELQKLTESDYGMRTLSASKISLGLSSNQALPKAMFEELVGQVDAAVTGLGS